MSKASVIENSIVVLGGSVCTEYGKDVTRCLVENLSVRGFNIVSGLETDISILALNLSLDINGESSGFLAGSINTAKKIKSVRKLIWKLTNYKKGSLYVPTESNKRPKNPFLDRDRAMISACSAVLVIEALLGSRIFHAVEFAVENNKPIFVVSGSVFSYTSKGASFLLKTGAFLVRSHEDILNHFK